MRRAKALAGRRDLPGSLGTPPVPLDLSPLQQRIASHAATALRGEATGGQANPVEHPPRLTAAERVLAAELQARGDCHDALSMMVSSMARMVQAGRTSDSRWKAS
jgi:hypothetical protein